jgi:hypothetical protein
MNKFSFKKVGFYEKSDQSDFYECFIVNANDEVALIDNSIINSGVFFKIEIYKKLSTLFIDLELLSWSNSELKNVTLERSIWAEEGFGGGENIPIIKNHYSKIISNFFTAMEQLKYHWQLKDMLHKMKHPTFIFHYKLLNLFTQVELEKIMLAYFENHPIFNVSLFNQRPRSIEIGYLFLPHTISGLYIDGMELSVDLDQSDMPIIEDNENGILSKEQFLSRLTLLEV